MKILKTLFTRKTLKTCPTGAIPSQEDPRDILSSGLIPEIKRKPEVFLPPFDLTVSNQSREPSCVGHACATLKQYNEFKERNNIQFDGDWIYQECKKVDNYAGNGTYLRVGMDRLHKVGAMPVGGGDPSKYRIGAYARVDDRTPDSLKNHILIYGTVKVGFTGSSEGWQGETIRPPKTGETTWGHAVTLVGYEKNYLIGQNSWDTIRHNKGFFRVPLSYSPFEGWVSLTDMPNEPLRAADGGWVAINFIEWKDGVLRTTYNLNVRKNAGTTHPIIKTLPRFTEVRFLDDQMISANGYIWRHIELIS